MTRTRLVVALLGSLLALRASSVSAGSLSGTVVIDGKPAAGAVVSAIPFTDLDAAIAGANDSPYGLAAGFFSGSIDKALTAARTLRFGAVHINETSSSRADAMPFGGVKDSGFGRERGEQGLLEFTTTKNVMIDFSDETRDPFAVKV